MQLLTLLSLFLALNVIQTACQAQKLEFTPAILALRTIDSKIKFLGCTYEVDQLFVLRCPSQTGLWVTDAQSLLASSNCKENCT